MRILAIDIGGSKVKCLLSGETERRAAPSGPDYTPSRFVEDVHRLLDGLTYDAVTIGFPGPIKVGRLLREPVNLGPGWVDFDYSAAFRAPVRLINDAAMQAIGSYQSGRMLFLGLGTGLGTAMIDRFTVLPLELGHLPYHKQTYEWYLGNRGKERLGKKAWRREVSEVCSIFRATLLPDEIVLGGGNAKEIKDLPTGCRLGDNSLAFSGGFRAWEPAWEANAPRHMAVPGGPITA
jgi:predicted NBD/HSP70 family sugar kinase